AAVGGEEARGWAFGVAGGIALGRVDLHDVGAEVGEDEPAGRPHHHLAELHDAEARERADIIGALGCALVGNAHAALRSAFGIPASCRWPVRCMAGMCALRM